MKLRTVAGLLLAWSLLGNPIIGDAYAQQKPGNSKSQPTQTAPPIDLSGVRDDLGRIAGALEAEKTDRKSPETQQEARDDVQAQRDMVFWAKMAAIIAGIATLGTAIGTILLLLNLRQVNEANKIASDALYRLEGGILRAEISEIIFGSQDEQGGIRVSVRIKASLNNIGRTPIYVRRIGMTIKQEGTNLKDVVIKPVNAVHQLEATVPNRVFSETLAGEGFVANYVEGNLRAERPVIRFSMLVLYTDSFDRHWSVSHRWQYVNPLTGPSIKPMVQIGPKLISAEEMSKAAGGE